MQEADVVTTWECHRAVPEDRCYYIERTGTYFYRYDRYKRVGLTLKTRRGRQYGANLTLKQPLSPHSVMRERHSGSHWGRAAESGLKQASLFCFQAGKNHFRLTMQHENWHFKWRT